MNRNRCWNSENAVKYFAIAFILAAGGCAHEGKSTAQSPQAASQVHSPYDHLLPQTLPSEANRVEAPAGYSIVSPPGWEVITGSPPSYIKDDITDCLVLQGQPADKWTPTSISLDHLGPGEYPFYKDKLHSTQSFPEGWKNWKHCEFQGQPALAEFLPGFGSHQSFMGSYQPWLTESLFFERDGNGFMLHFVMKNADRNKPYYTGPVPIIQKYFETFRFTPPKTNSQLAPSLSSPAH